MPRIVLAHWHGGAPPGAQIDVDDGALAALRRDGLIAAVVDAPPAAPETTDGAAEPDDAPEAESGPAEDAGPPRARRRR
ncbi:hypothetical protein ACIPEL_36390 [Streptomyces griseoviridis]